MTENADPRQRPSWFLPMLVSMVIATLTSPPLRAEEQVIVQLPWQHQFQFAGYYAAITKGFYQDAGLRVTLREANDRTDVVSEVISGKAHFGISGSDLLLDRAAGRPVVVLATGAADAGAARYPQPGGSGQQAADAGARLQRAADLSDPA